ncbi:hypothetical protein THAOC_13559 [Thalassiosira oceanica]|uniref:Uncharacterized protein n=1 Tax=Thalassiosira oceanica TaxID=159749 RepID=K0SKT5_THAOC|nr:hypothetical protein THAOC_13559 [Thalassiosira oceanica]|eukprot:EJK65564.1 hypothetical protein THAOC_13559 [Thalassiosira oceanica]
MKATRRSRSVTRIAVLIAAQRPSSADGFTPFFARRDRPSTVSSSHHDDTASRRRFNFPAHTGLDDESESYEALRHGNSAGGASIPNVSSRKRRRKLSSMPSTFASSVCIVPPDDAWDSIQRARHLSKDTTFYKWPPAIRLFHPFAPTKYTPLLVGELAEWIEEEGTIFEMEMELSGYSSQESDDIDGTTSGSLSAILQPFDVTMDSILILPHYEILESRIDGLDQRSQQETLGPSAQEVEEMRRIEEGKALVEEQERMGAERKKDRDRKRALKQRRKDLENGRLPANELENNDGTEDDSNQSNPKKKDYDGPCVLYLSPDEESRIKLEALREELRDNLFSSFDAFSVSASVTPEPQFLPRKRSARKFRPLLPLGRFQSVQEAMDIAKVLQRAWEPLSFTVTDIQFVSKEDELSSSGIGFGNVENVDDIPEVMHRRKHGTLESTGDYTNRMALTTSGEEDDISQKGMYGCDAMVMMWGEEPVEEFMDEEATLSMMVGDSTEDDDFNLEDWIEDDETPIYGKIDYDEVFATAEREYQRMKAHEDLSAESFLDSVPTFDSDEARGIEAWLDEDDLNEQDEGATIVVGRAQFFFGAMRDFVGMPASSALDGKDRVGKQGVNAMTRRKGAVKRLAESWDSGDYGRKR